jgi:hypothetical protein
VICEKVTTVVRSPATSRTSVPLPLLAPMEYKPERRVFEQARAAGALRPRPPLFKQSKPIGFG